MLLFFCILSLLLDATASNTPLTEPAPSPSPEAILFVSPYRATFTDLLNDTTLDQKPPILSKPVSYPIQPTDSPQAPKASQQDPQAPQPLQGKAVLSDGGTQGPAPQQVVVMEGSNYTGLSLSEKSIMMVDFVVSGDMVVSPKSSVVLSGVSGQIGGSLEVPQGSHLMFEMNSKKQSSLVVNCLHLSGSIQVNVSDNFMKSSEEFNLISYNESCSVVSMENSNVVSANSQGGCYSLKNKAASISMIYTDSCDKNAFPIGAVIGGILALLIVLILIFIIALRKSKTLQKIVFPFRDTAKLTQKSSSP